MKTLGATPAALSGGPVAASALRSQTPQQAAERNLSQLRVSAGRVMTDGGCVACHAQPMAALATTLATRRGWRAEPVTEAITQMQQAVNGALQPLLQFTIAGGAPEGQLSDVLAIHAVDGPPTLSIDALLHYLAGTQSSAGQWHRSAINRAPIQNGDLSGTALAINAFVHYAPPTRAAEFKAVVNRAANWLAGQEPSSTEERVMQLLGQTWAGALPSQLERRVGELMALQQPDGGWSQSPYLATDAYATGQALYALTALQVPPTQTAIQKGIAYLLATQQADGTWHVRSRAMPIQPYFESGFPYARDQWISFAGTPGPIWRWLRSLNRSGQRRPSAKVAATRENPSSPFSLGQTAWAGREGLYWCSCRRPYPLMPPRSHATTSPDVGAPLTSRPGSRLRRTPPRATSRDSIENANAECPS